MTSKQLPKFDDKFKERFWKKVNKSDGCWEWIGMKNKLGYGKMRFGPTRILYAHRISFVIENGEIGEGLGVLHKCDNPKCVRPSHLFQGTHLDNMRDMFSKGRRIAATGDRSASRLHRESRPRGEGHFKAKVTAQDVLQIREKRLSGMSAITLASINGVDRQSIYDIVKRKTWTHI